MHTSGNENNNAIDEHNSTCNFVNSTNERQHFSGASSDEHESKSEELSLEERTETLVIDSGASDSLRINTRLAERFAEEQQSRERGNSNDTTHVPQPIAAPPVPSLVTSYELQEVLGNGAFSKVFAGRHRFTNLPVAVKIVSFSSFKPGDLARQLNILNNEVAILRKITLELPSQDNLIRLVDVVKEDHQLGIVMEVLRGKELFDRIVERVSYTEKDAVKLMHQLVGAVNALHNIGILHRDLKPENLVFVDDGENSRIKITDFGLAQVVGWSDVHRSVVGTPGYVSPEVLTTKVYSPACDIWSLGVILYILLVGYPPFYAEENSELFEIIKKGKFHFYEQEWGSISSEAKDLVSRMLTVNPSDRITGPEILGHPWMVKKQSEVPLGTAIGNLSGFNARRKFKAILAAVKIGTHMKIRRKLLTLVKSSDANVFDLSELIKIRQTFLRGARDNVLDSADALESVLRGLGFGMIPKDRLFDVFDINNDGSIQYTEFLAYLSALKASGEPALRLCFELYDFDQSGSISASEIRTVLSSTTNCDAVELTNCIEDIFVSLDVSLEQDLSFNDFSVVVFDHPVLVETFLAPLHELDTSDIDLTWQSSNKYC